MNNTELGYNPDEGTEAMPQTRVIKFKDSEVEIPTAPLCTIEQIHAAQQIVNEKYPALAELLPEGHPWREDKAMHGVHTQEKGLILGELDFDQDDPNARLIMFIGEVHDLGRVIDGLKKLKESERAEHPVPKGFENMVHHGEYSVEILKDWKVLEGFSPETQEIINFAVLNHSKKEDTPLPENATAKERIEYVYNTIFRDLDKLTGLVDKAEKYLTDPATREKQFNVVIGILRSVNKEFLGETGQVTPEGLALFLDGKLNDVHEFYTYETYMLNTLGFIFNINLPAALEVAVNSNVTDKFLDYFREHKSDDGVVLHMPKDQFDQIESKVKTYVDEMQKKLTI